MGFCFASAISSATDFAGSDALATSYARTHPHIRSSSLVQPGELGGKGEAVEEVIPKVGRDEAADGRQAHRRASLTGTTTDVNAAGDGRAAEEDDDDSHRR